MSAQKRNAGLQHLQSSVTPREPVVFVLERDQLDLFAGFPQSVVHALTLFERHDSIVAPVD
jgi:hypothetical protein